MFRLTIKIKGQIRKIKLFVSKNEAIGWGDKYVWDKNGTYTVEKIKKLQTQKMKESLSKGAKKFLQKNRNLTGQSYIDRIFRMANGYKLYTSVSLLMKRIKTLSNFKCLEEEEQFLVMVRLARIWRDKKDNTIFKKI